MLKITPILTLREGVVTPVQRTRSRTQAIDALVNLVKGANKIDALMLQHATTPDELEILAKRVAEFYPREKTYFSTVNAVIGAHVGPVLGEFHRGQIASVNTVGESGVHDTATQ
jgi:fatty acid-binding protein DegV